MKKTTPSQSMYITFGVIIAVLLAMIGYFAYLLLAPEPTSTTNTNNSNTEVTSNTNTTKNVNKKKANGNKNTANVNAEDTETNDNANTNEGLVEPTNDNTNGITEDAENSNENAEENANTNEVVAGEGEQVITLYFTKSGAACGTVYPVKRAVTPSDDFYGQIILAVMAGPDDEETGYTSAVPSDLRLRWVEYGADGPMVYVNEAFNDLDDCDQKTVHAQLIETANAMFDLPEGGEGEVIVGYPEGQDPNEEDTEESDTNDNTNE